MMREDIMREIISLRFDLDNFREARMFGKVAEIRLEIARLEGILENMK